VVTEIPLTHQVTEQGLGYRFFGEFEVFGPSIRIELEITMPSQQTRRYSPRMYPLPDGSEAAIRSVIAAAALEFVTNFMRNDAARSGPPP